MSNTVTKLEPKRSILGSLGERYGMDPKALEMTLRKTVMPNPHSDEEFAACCLVAHEHKLNPITKEIYFMRTKGNAIQPIVGVDGWIKKCNEHPAFDGMDFEDAHDDKGALTAIKCKIYRQDRKHAIVVTEYLTECRRPTDNWKQMPARMLRHRALIQCARVAFGFAGIMDPDEFEQWQERYRGEAARDITPTAIAKPPLLDMPDIPDGTEEAGPPRATDEEFLTKLDDAYGATKDLDDLNEVMLHNENEVEERGLQQAAGDLYDKHKTRIYDGMI